MYKYLSFRSNKLFTYLGYKKNLLVLYLLVNPINSALEVLLAYTTAIAIEYAINGSLDQIGMYIAAFFVYVIVWFLFSLLHTYLRNKILEHAVAHLKQDLMERILFSPPTVFHKTNTGTYLSHLTNDCEIIRNSYFFELLRLYGQVVQLVIALAAMFFISWIIGAFVVFMALVQVAISTSFKKIISHLGALYSRQQQAYTQTCKETLQSFQTANLYDVRHELSNLHAEAAQQTEHARFRSKLMNSIVNELSFSAGTVMYLGIFLIGAVLSLKGVLGVGAIIAAAQLMGHIATPLTNISTDIAELQTSFEIADHLQAILDIPFQNQPGMAKDRFDSALTVQNLSFHYNQKEIFHNINCTFEKGKKYLIVGPSGSGKSTLLSLLTGQLPLQNGSITLDGHPLNQLSTAALHQLILLSPQEPYLFDWTIAENIRLFRPIAEERIETWLDQVGLCQKIRSLPNGIHTRFGEGGNEFSGGEKQRVGLVRALARNAPILLLDECTSHLDAVTAKRVEDLLLQLQDTTVILVSHNPSHALRHAVDKVFVMQNGVLTDEVVGK